MRTLLLAAGMALMLAGGSLAFAQVAPTFSGTSTMQTFGGDSVLQDLSNVGSCLPKRLLFVRNCYR